MKEKNENKMSVWNKIRNSKYFELSGLICLIIVYSIVVQAKSGMFLSIGNINNILKEIVVYGILSCALAFPIINGTFDRSIESTCALGGTICALLVTDGLMGLKTNLLAAVIISVFI